MYFVLVLLCCNGSRLSEAAADAVKQLLPEYAGSDLGSVCSWADEVRFRYHWSAPLHFINTPDVCNYKYTSKLLFCLYMNTIPVFSLSLFPFPVCIASKSDQFLFFFSGVKLPVERRKPNLVVLL